MTLTMQFNISNKKLVKKFLRLLLGRLGTISSLRSIRKGRYPHKLCADIVFPFESFWNDFVNEGAEFLYESFNEDPQQTIMMMEEEDDCVAFYNNKYGP